MKILTEVFRIDNRSNHLAFEVTTATHNDCESKSEHQFSNPNVSLYKTETYHIFYQYMRAKWYPYATLIDLLGIQMWRMTYVGY